MKAIKKKLLRLAAVLLPVTALAIALPLSFVIPASRLAPASANQPATATTGVHQAIASTNQQAAETEFDAFFAASNNGAPGSAVKLNAVVALYAAIGQTVTQAQAAALNANSGRDLLNKLSARDNNTVLSGGWTLNLSTNNFDGLSLSTLSFLQYFPNLTGLSLVALPGNAPDNPNSFTIDSLQDIAWISRLRGLKTLRIVNDAVKNPTQLDSTGLSVLANLPLSNVDFSRFLSTASGTTAARPIFATLDLTQPWYLTMPYGFVIQMPAGYVVSANNSLYTVQTGDGVQTTITKAIAPALTNPTAAYRTVYLDGDRYDAVLADSVLIWPFDATTFNSIAFTDAANNYYRSAGPNRYPVTRRTLNAAEVALYNRYSFQSSRNETDIYRVLTLNSGDSQNATYIESTVVVDGITVPRIMVNGRLYWAFNQKTALFRNDQLTKFWTSYERISAEDLNPNNADKIQSISSTIANALADRSAGYVTTIDPPASEAQVFYVNNTPVAAVRDLRDTSQKKYFWDFARQGIRPEQIRFYSRSTLKAFTSVAAIVNESRTEGFNFAAYSSARIATFDSIPTDNDPANLPSDITGLENIRAYLAKNTASKVSIDGVLYDYVLRNGSLFVNYDTSLINFVVVSGTNKLYYTSDSKIPAAQVANVKLLPKIPVRTVPNQRAILAPNLPNQLFTITLNGAETISYAINNGKLYWRFAGSTVSGLSSIKYVNNFSDFRDVTYFTRDLFELSAETIVNNALTEVVPTADDPNAISSSFAYSMLLSPQFDRTNYFIIDLHDKITIDSTDTYTRRIAHSKVYWISSTGVPRSSFSNITLQEFDGTDEQLAEAPFFYTTTARASASPSFPSKVRQITPPLTITAPGDTSEITITDPKSATETMTVYSKGVPIVLRARAYGDLTTPYIWSDNELVEQIRYAAKQPDGSFIYLTDLNEQTWQTSGLNTSDITDAEVEVTKAVITRDALFQDNVYEIEVVKYALIGVFSALFAAAIGVFLWRVFRK